MRKLKKFTEKDGVTVGDLLHFGYDHIDTGLFLLKNGSVGGFQSAGYLLQLGIELVLKAWHLFKCKEFYDTHKLEEIINSLNENKIFNEKELKTLHKLNEFYHLRYPRKNHPIIGNDLQDIELFLDKLWQHLPTELCEIYSNLKPNKKEGQILMRKKISDIEEE